MAATPPFPSTPTNIHQQFPSPSSPAFPTSALHQPSSRPDSQPLSAPPSVLPGSPASTAYAVTMNAQKPPSPTNPTNSTVYDGIVGRTSNSSLGKDQQQQEQSQSRKSQQQQSRQQQQRQQHPTPLANSTASHPQLPNPVTPAWSPAHPCFPHPNPHVPLHSPLYDATRIIRIPRDWMVAGDLYPAFSTTYPEILLPWIPEASFRNLIAQVNVALKRAFEPATGRAVVDGVLGFVGGWVLEDVGVVGPKRRVREVEAVIERWNKERGKEGASGSERGFAGTSGEEVEEQDLVCVLPLRRTAYMSLDIQVPDPKIINNSGLRLKSSSVHNSVADAREWPQPQVT